MEIDSTTLNLLAGVIISLLSIGLGIVKRSHWLTQATLDKVQADKDQLEIMFANVMQAAKDGNVSETEFQAIISAFGAIRRINAKPDFIASPDETIQKVN